MERVWLARSRARQHADATCKRRANNAKTYRSSIAGFSFSWKYSNNWKWVFHAGQLIYFRRAVTPEGGVVAMVVPGHRPARHLDTIVVRAWGKARSEANALAICLALCLFGPYGLIPNIPSLALEWDLEPTRLTLWEIVSTVTQNLSFKLFPLETMSPCTVDRDWSLLCPKASWKLKSMPRMLAAS